jgi:predicted site-specific integrase-resolvase
VSGRGTLAGADCESPSQLLEASAAARVVGIARETLLAAVRRGELRVAALTSRGTRLFVEDEVQRFTRARQERLARRRHP